MLSIKFNAEQLYILERISRQHPNAKLKLILSDSMIMHGSYVTPFSLLFKLNLLQKLEMFLTESEMILSVVFLTTSTCPYLYIHSIYRLAETLTIKFTLKFLEHLTCNGEYRGGYARMDLTVRTIRVQNQLINNKLCIVYSNRSALLFLNIPKVMPIWVIYDN